MFNVSSSRFKARVCTIVKLSPYFASMSGMTAATAAVMLPAATAAVMLPTCMKLMLVLTVCVLIIIVEQLQY